MRRLVLSMLAIAIHAAGQGVIVSAGYESQPYLEAVPGELITLRLAGLGLNSIDPFFAHSVPLPFEVNGLQVVIEYAEFSPEPIEPVQHPAAIHSVRAESNVTAITVQVPPEIVTSRNYLGSFYSSTLRPNAKVIVRLDGVSISEAPMNLFRQHIRIVKSCDLRYEDSPLWNGRECLPMLYNDKGIRVNRFAGGQKITILVSGFQVPRGGDPGIIWKSGWPNPDQESAAGRVFYLMERATNRIGTQPWLVNTTSPTPTAPYNDFRAIPGEYGLGFVELTLPDIPLAPFGQGNCPNLRDTSTSNVTITLDFDAALRLCVAPTPQSVTIATQGAAQ